MADAKSQRDVLDGLQKALAEPTGLPLLVSKGVGLFANNAAGKAAAKACQDAGWLTSVRKETKGKTTTEYFGLSEPGLGHLLAETSSKPVLTALLEAVQRCQGRIHEWIESVQKSQQILDALRNQIFRVLEHLEQPGALAKPGKNVADVLLARLAEWQSAGKLGDCPMPELFHAARPYAQFTTGQFHDALRQLHEKEKVYLHPWSGPLYELPQPELSLLVGHEIAYYVSLR